MNLTSLAVGGQLATLSLAAFFANRNFFYQDQARIKSVFYTVGIGCTVLFGSSVLIPLMILSRARPVVYDPVIYQIEAISGLSPAEIVWASSASAHHILGICQIVYDNLPIIIILAASSQLIYSPWHFRDNLFVQFAVGAVIGYLLYYILPAVGPGIYFHGKFPFHMPSPAQVPAIPVVFNDGGATPRNAMPSMHAAWAILSFLALRYSPLWQNALGLLYVIVTFVTTIGLGYHYILDWVVALPLVLLIRGLTDAQPLVGPRIMAVVVGVLLLAVWCVIIRAAPVSLTYPRLIQAVIVASVFLPVSIGLRMAREKVLPLEPPEPRV